jgi:hypothetical protein
MTSLTDTQVVTASGGLVELGYAENDANLSITATTGAGMDNISPELTVVCDGSPIMVEFFCAGARATTSGSGTTDALWFALKVDGSVEEERLGVVGNVASGYGSLTPIKLSHRMTPSAGSHTFRVGGWVSNAARSGYIGGGSPYPPAWIRVSKIVEATQWPAVTTGTIICTSSTRPASPFEGQKIYETDTDRELTYDSSAWVQTNSLGGWSTWTPQLYQNGNLTSTIPHARYTRIGDTAIVQGKVSATQAGTAGQQIEIRNLPYSAEAAGDYTVIGNAIYWDGTLRWQLNIETLPTATSIAFGYDSAPFAAYGGGRFGASPSKAVASGDFISFTTTYEIA